jgi:hypothetical protein
VTEAEIETNEISIGETAEHTIGTAGGDRWLFEGEEGQTVIITMDAEFDTYLELYDEDGQLVAENDDFDGLNSQIGPLDLPADGTYTIVARSFSGDTGSYELSVREG